ncbi:MAG: phytanoyl-CoA dioxygenase family protein [Bacteroidia bacterium]|nr:phytanoyl-CoA dioxygenase family protein [Bacteroidia bacterium]
MDNEQGTMNPTMAPTMIPHNAHKDIPGNPSTATSSRISLNDRSNGQPLRVLSEADWAFWVENGYIVIKQAVPREQALRTADFIWEFEEKDPQRQETWYAPPRAEMKMKELTGTGMVEVYNHQLLWDNRSVQRVYDAFVDIWGTEKLWVTIDRANLNFPIRPGFEYKGFIHWDYDPETKPQNVQGVLALADQTDENMGGFQCIPELYRTYDTWKLTQPADRNRFQPDVTGLEDKIVKVKMEAGDLLIFNSTQPHGIRPNRSGDKVRIAQYISMMPAEEDNEALRQWRVNSWRDRIAPEGYAFPGDPRRWEQTRYETAVLNDLGKKLLGLESW